MPIYRRFNEAGNPTPPVWGNFSEEEIAAGGWIEDDVFLSSPEYLAWNEPPNTKKPRGTTKGDE